MTAAPDGVRPTRTVVSCAKGVFIRDQQGATQSHSLIHLALHMGSGGAPYDRSHGKCYIATFNTNTLCHH